MSNIQIQYSKSQINKAGDILKDFSNYPHKDIIWAIDVLSNWRSVHSYPINTLKVLLRKKISQVSSSSSVLVAQRLKRAPSIISKLQRFSSMRLARMQDIGGLRAILHSVKQVEKLKANYKNTKFLHELVDEKDYIREPKSSGYRGVHLIYKFKSPQNQDYQS